MKKKVSLFQVNFRMGPKNMKIFYLPYSIGCIWSYASQFDFVKENYHLDYIGWKRDKIEDIIDRVKDNHIVGFSTYVWNKNYNCTLAKKIKELNPNCLTVFGGPEISTHDEEVFKTHPYIDIIIKNEGEIAFKEILENIDDIKSIKGLLINDNGTRIDTGSSNRVPDLTNLPSPYLTGFYDEIMRENPDCEWNVVLETNRGCPYHCTFCDWGSLTYSKVKKFGLEKVFAELEWMGKNKCGYLIIADANFGMFLERDKMIADKIVEVQTQYGYPVSMNTSWAKNQKKEVLAIVKTLLDSPRAINNGLTLSFQSFTPKVLENIKRSNLPLNNGMDIMRLANEMGIDNVSIEMILGLPGETLQTWKKNIYDILKYYDGYHINIHQSQLLENAEMGIEREKFNFKTTKLKDYFSLGNNSEDNRDTIPEFVEMVIETDTMPFDDMIEAAVFNSLIMTFHHSGMTNFISKFLYKFKNVEYDVFYESLFKFLEKDEWWRNKINEQRYYFRQWMTNGEIVDHPSIGKYALDIDGLTMLFRLKIYTFKDDYFENTFKIIKEYTNQFNIDNNISNELFKLQTNNVIRFKEISDSPKKIHFDLNLWGYIVKDDDLYKSTNLIFDSHIANKHKDDFDTFLVSLFWRRRRKYAQANISYESKNLEFNKKIDDLSLVL